MGFMRANAIHRRALTLVLAIAGTAIVSAKPASAQIFSDTPLKGALTTLGIVAPERDPIEYHERAPLVVPKSLDLPAPAQHVAERNPEWPTDPDVAAKLKEKAESAHGTAGSAPPSIRMRRKPRAASAISIAAVILATGSRERNGFNPGMYRARRAFRRDHEGAGCRRPRARGLCGDRRPFGSSTTRAGLRPATRRTVSSGSSVTAVLTPTSTASTRARRRCRWSRPAGPLMDSNGRSPSRCGHRSIARSGRPRRGRRPCFCGRVPTCFPTAREGGHPTSGITLELSPSHRRCSSRCRNVRQGKPCLRPSASRSLTAVHGTGT